MKRASLIFFFALFLHYNFHPTNIGSVLLEKEGLFDEIVKGNDVDLMITHSGIYDVKLIDQSIKFRIWTDKCYGRLTVCYDSVDYESVQAPSTCKKSKQAGFDLEIDPTHIRLIDGKFAPGKGHKNGCETLKSDEESVYNTGRPYIKPGYIITLNVIHASPYCSLIVRNASLEERAFISLPPKSSRSTSTSSTQTMSTPSLSKPTASQRSPTLANLTPLSSPMPNQPSTPSPSCLPTPPSTPSPPSTSTFSTPLELTWYENVIDSLRKPLHFGLPRWFWIIVISFVIALFIFFLLFMGLCIYVKCIQKKKCQPKVYEVPKLSNKKLKVEGSKESKEFKATVQAQSKSTVEALTVSSVDPPVSTLLPATSTQLPPSDSAKLEDLKLSLLQPSPTTTTTNSTTNGSSKKSQMTTTTDSSLPEKEEALTQALTTTNKKVLLEPHYASLLRNGCLGKNNSAKAREMR
uniref:Uncharacterized protein n=1 Tax=Panagrolaimus sp. PS1159 TaxID=55785 RepID=A0AC35GY16_9BILA